MDANQRDDNPRQTPRATERDDVTAEEALRNAPPGSSNLNAAPPTQSPGDNAVNRSSRDAGDVLAEEVRQGRWNASQQERDEQRED